MDAHLLCSQLRRRQTHSQSGEVRTFFLVELLSATAGLRAQTAIVLPDFHFRTEERWLQTSQGNMPSSGRKAWMSLFKPCSFRP